MSSPVHPEGRLTANPELRFTNSGKAVAQFTVVTSRRFNNNGVWEDKDTSFWDCTAFGEMAERVCENLKKGTAVIVSGHMRQETWEKDGQKKYAWRVAVDNIGESLKFRKPAENGGNFNDEPPF